MGVMEWKTELLQRQRLPHGIDDAEFIIFSTSQSPAWQTESRNNPVVMNVFKLAPDCADPWLDTSSNSWPLDEHHYAQVFARMTLLWGAAYIHRPPVLPPSERTGATA